MPGEPVKYKYTDKYIYDLYKKYIPKKYCVISPNLITVLGFLLVIPIFFNIVNNRSIFEAIILIVLITVLDCLDGAHARKCDKTSLFGSRLDTISDILKILIITFGFSLKLLGFNNLFIYKFVLIMIFIIGCLFLLFNKTIYNLIDKLNETLYKKSKINEVFILYHDNTIVIWTVIIVICKVILKRKFSK